MSLAFGPAKGPDPKALHRLDGFLPSTLTSLPSSQYNTSVRPKQPYYPHRVVISLLLVWEGSARLIPALESVGKHKKVDQLMASRDRCRVGDEGKHDQLDSFRSWILLRQNMGCCICRGTWPFYFITPYALAKPNIWKLIKTFHPCSRYYPLSELRQGACNFQGIKETSNSSTPYRNSHL